MEKTNFEFNVYSLCFAVKDVEHFSSFLVEKLGFQLFAKRIIPRNSLLPETLVFKYGCILLVINDRDDNSFGDEVLFNRRANYKADTVYDVCLECNSINEVMPVTDNHLPIYQTFENKKYKVQDEHGVVSYTVLKSPISNVQHTLIDFSMYNGPFCPGFEVFPVDEDSVFPIMTSIDHIAFCVPFGETDRISSWYQKYFNFRRVLMNSDDNLDDGFTVSRNNSGLRLKEIICPSWSSETTFISGNEDINFKTRLVFAESLTNTGYNQIDQFLRNHFGAGIQHIAFGTSDLCKTIKELEGVGLSYIQYPEEYYTELAENKKVRDLNVDVDKLQKSNALLEFHDGDIFAKDQDIYLLDINEQRKYIENTFWFIIQAFTKPIFPEETLFLEFIQRRNTQSGLGATNISTIWEYSEKANLKPLPKLEIDE